MSKQLRILLIIVGITFLSVVVHSSDQKWQNIKTDYHKDNDDYDDDEKITSATLQKSIFLMQEDSPSYYYYNVYSKNNKIIVKILYKDLTTQKLVFAKDKYKIEFRDAYDRYIIVEQIDIKTKESVSFWVIKIVQTKKGHVLQSFAVDSISDSDGYKFKGEYTLTEIIEYDQIKGLLYVIMDSKTDYNIYKIDLTEKKAIRKLQIVGWFFYSVKKRETIVGGNSRVLVEASDDQLWIDSRKPFTVDKPSTYKKYDIEDLTKLKIYTSGSRAYNFISSYFQYVSVSKDMMNMNAFVYSGYQKTKPIAQGSLCSDKKPIKFYSDEETYFVAVADNDVYFTLVYWNETISDYTAYSSTLRETVKDKKLWSQYISSFRESIIIVLYDLKFFILTEDAFYVQNGLKIEKFQLKDDIEEGDDLQKILFKHMLWYEKGQIKSGKNVKKGDYWKKWN